jgi:hypothetical protein
MLIPFKDSSKIKIIKKLQNSKKTTFFIIFLLVDGRILIRSWSLTNKL